MSSAASDGLRLHSVVSTERSCSGESVSSSRFSGSGRAVVCVRARFVVLEVSGEMRLRWAVDGEGVGEEDMISVRSVSSDAFRFLEVIVVGGEKTGTSVVV